jgi:hypothetical protein
VYLNEWGLASMKRMPSWVYGKPGGVKGVVSMLDSVAGILD